jgi:hypothetical protein
MNSSTIHALEEIHGFCRQGMVECLDLEGRYRDAIKRCGSIFRVELQMAGGEIQADVYAELLASIELIETGIKRGDYLNPRHPMTWPGYNEAFGPRDTTEAGGVVYNFLFAASSIVGSLLSDYDDLKDLKRGFRETLFRHAGEASREEKTIPLDSCEDIIVPRLYRGTFEAFMPKHRRGKALAAIYRLTSLPTSSLPRPRSSELFDMAFRYLQAPMRQEVARVEIDGNYMRGDVDFLYFTISQMGPNADSMEDLPD